VIAFAHDEAEDLARQARGASRPIDVQSETIWRTVMAKVLARRGESAAAEELAREAIAFVEQSDFLPVQADALMGSGGDPPPGWPPRRDRPSRRPFASTSRRATPSQPPRRAPSWNAWAEEAGNGWAGLRPARVLHDCVASVRRSPRAFGRAGWTAHRLRDPRPRARTAPLSPSPLGRRSALVVADEPKDDGAAPNRRSHEPFVCRRI
jgi:hypothetical protein